MLKKISVSLIASSILFSAFAGGMVFHFETKNLKSEGSVHKGTMYILGKNITMKMGGQDEQGYMIFRGDKELLWTVDDSKKEYTEMDKEMMEKMGQAMGNVMQSMEAQMANVPPEQRAMIEGMMKQQMQQTPGSQKQEMTFKKTGQKKKIDGYPCIKYEVYREKEKVREMWVAEWVSFKSGKDIETAFKAMSDFFVPLMEVMKSSPLFHSIDNPYSHNEKVNGFPVVVTEFDDGKPSMVTTFKKSENKKIKASMFDPPKGYKLIKPDMSASE
jgi:hypothetical protein